MDVKDKIREALLELGYERRSGLTFTDGIDHIKIDYDDEFIGQIVILKNFYKYVDGIYMITHTYEEYYNMLLGELRKQKIDKIR